MGDQELSQKEIRISQIYQKFRGELGELRKKQRLAIERYSKILENRRIGEIRKGLETI